MRQWPSPGGATFWNIRVGDRRYHLTQLTLLDIREWGRWSLLSASQPGPDLLRWQSRFFESHCKAFLICTLHWFLHWFPGNVLVMTQDTFSSSLFEPTIHEGLLIYFSSNRLLSKEKALYKYKHWRSLLRNARVSSWHMSLCKTAREWGMRQRFELKILFLL